MRKWGVEETQHQQKKPLFNTRTASNRGGVSKMWHRGPKTEGRCAREPALAK